MDKETSTNSVQAAHLYFPREECYCFKF